MAAKIFELPPGTRFLTEAELAARRQAKRPVKVAERQVRKHARRDVLGFVARTYRRGKRGLIRKPPRGALRSPGRGF